MRFLDYLKKTTDSQSLINIPGHLTKQSTCTKNNSKASDRAIREAIIDTLKCTGFSYARLHSELKTRHIDVCLATIHKISTDPNNHFGKYDTHEILPILNEVKEMYQTGIEQPWVDRFEVKRKIEEWSNHPIIINKAEKENKSPSVYLRDLLGYQKRRSIFSQWKNGRYKVRSEIWLEATEVVTKILGRKE